MKILIACEYSGIVRDAFTAKGHDAISCDILPTESTGKHYQGDVFDIINDGFDMLVAFPPCTYLSYAGIAHWHAKDRLSKRLEALDFFARLYSAKIPKIYIENPKGCASPTIAKYSQEIQPYYFGDSAIKTTWLWLQNLEQLKHENQDTLFSNKTHANKPEPIYIDKNGKNRHHTDAMKGGKDRQKERARFWPSIANAMAQQWG